MNVLSEADRARLLLLYDEGHGIREIERLTGVHRDTVSIHVGGLQRTRKMREFIDRIWDWLESKGLEPTECDGYVDLQMELYRCHRHPLAIPLEDVDDDGCRLCVAEQLRRHHERRKDAGAPILPPWRRSTAIYGEDNANSKLTNIERNAVRMLYVSGFGYKRLAAAFDIAPNTIKYIVTRRHGARVIGEPTLPEPAATSPPEAEPAPWASYTSLNLPPDTTRRLFREECTKIPRAVRRGRIWSVSRAAWDAHRERRRGVAAENVGGRPATGSVVWADEAKTVPKAVRVTKPDGKRKLVPLKEIARLLAPVVSELARATAPAAPEPLPPPSIPVVALASVQAMTAPDRTAPTADARRAIAAKVEQPLVVETKKLAPAPPKPKAKAAPGGPLTKASLERAAKARKSAQGGVERMRVCLDPGCRRENDHALGGFKATPGTACARCGRVVEVGEVICLLPPGLASRA